MNDLERLAGPTAAGDITAWAGNLLRRARRHTGTTTAKLADLSGVSKDVITDIESGDLQPTLPLLSQLLIAMGKELRIRLEDFDDHDKILDQRATSFPERQADLEAGVDRFVAAVSEHPAVKRGSEHGDDSLDADRGTGAAVPVYEVAQPNGTTVRVDFTPPGAFSDLAFTADFGDRVVELSTYHTGETAIFTDVLRRFLADQTLQQRNASLATIRTELARITTGRAATERGENSFPPFLLDALEHPVTLTDLTNTRYRTSSRDGSELVLTPTTHGLDISLDRGGSTTAVFGWSAGSLWQLAAGMIWRSYAESGDDFSLLSRVPTIEYLTALQAADGAETGGEIPAT